VQSMVMIERCQRLDPGSIPGRQTHQIAGTFLDFLDEDIC
jgi:hypothetical protein